MLYAILLGPIYGRNNIFYFSNKNNTFFLSLNIVCFRRLLDFLTVSLMIVTCIVKIWILRFVVQKVNLIEITTKHHSGEELSGEPSKA